MSIDYVSRRVMDTYMDRAIIKHQRLQNRIRAQSLAIVALETQMKTMESEYDLLHSNVMAVMRAIERLGGTVFEHVLADSPTEGLGS